MKKVYTRKKFDGLTQIRNWDLLKKGDIVCDTCMDPRHIELSSLAEYRYSAHSGFVVVVPVSRQLFDQYMNREEYNLNRRYSVWRKVRKAPPVWIENENGRRIVNPDYVAFMAGAAAGDPDDLGLAVKGNKRKRERPKIFVPKSVFHSTPLPLP